MMGKRLLTLSGRYMKRQEPAYSLAAVSFLVLSRQHCCSYPLPEPPPPFHPTSFPMAKVESEDADGTTNPRARWVFCSKHWRLFWRSTGIIHAHVREILGAPMLNSGTVRMGTTPALLLFEMHHEHQSFFPLYSPRAANDEHGDTTDAL